MKAPKNTTNSNSEPRKDFLTPDMHWIIKRATKFQNGNIGFDLVINGISVYGLVFTWSERNNKWFTSFPSRRSNDGKYYNIVYIPLTDRDNSQIEAALEQLTD